MYSVVKKTPPLKSVVYFWNIIIYDYQQERKTFDGGERCRKNVTWVGNITCNKSKKNCT